MTNMKRASGSLKVLSLLFLLLAPGSPLRAPQPISTGVALELPAL